MDYTTVYRPLIYKDRNDIDDFPVDETDDVKYLTMESVFMEKLEARPFVKASFDAPELILMIFNNARYIATLILRENHPQHYLHKYLKIAGEDSQDVVICNHAMPATMALVINYMHNYLREVFRGSRIAKAIVENFEDWDTKGASEGKQDFYELLIEPPSEIKKYKHWATDYDRDGLLSFRDIQEVVYDNDIETSEIIAEIDYIIMETFGVYEGQPECSQILEAIRARMKDFERTEQPSEALREKLDIAYKKLKSYYPNVGLEWEEDTSIFFESKINSYPPSCPGFDDFDPERDSLHRQIEELKAEVERLKKDKNSFEEHSRKRGALAESLRSDKEILRAERDKLREENTWLKEQIEDKSPEQAFNAAGNECFTKAKMGLLIYTIASIKDGPTPVKAKLAPIISSIGGWELTSVSSEMKKAGFRQGDIDEVADLFENVMPEFASEIRKQIPRPPKTKK